MVYFRKIEARLCSLSLAVCCGVLTSPLLSAAELVFYHPSVEVHLPIDSQEAKAVFLFTNPSQSAVRVLEVRTECDCIQTSMPAHEVEAGKTGEITIRFRSKLRNGTDVVRAKVVTESNEIHEISVSAKLRSYIEVSPLTLHWMKGEKRDAKVFIVSSTGLGKLNFTKVASVKNSKVEIQRDENPTAIQVHVTPPAGADLFQDILVVSAVVEGTSETKLYNLHVSAE